jgi:hypothetical protein
MARRPFVAAAGCLSALLASATMGAAQSSAAARLAAARVQAHAMRFDSAARLARGALDSVSGASRSDRVEAWLLLGVVEFYQGHDSGTGAAFRQALELEPQLDASELSRYDSALVLLLEAQRQTLGTRPAAPPSDPNALVDCTRLCPDVVYPQLIEFRPNWPAVDRFDVLHYRGSMTVRFATDTAGGVLPGSITLVFSALPPPLKPVAQAWLDALARARFKPAHRAAGQQVSALLDLRVAFERGRVSNVSATSGRRFVFVPGAR